MRVRETCLEHVVERPILEHVHFHGLSQVEHIVELFLAEHVHREHVLPGESVRVSLTRAVTRPTQQCGQGTSRAQRVPQSIQGQTGWRFQLAKQSI